MAWTRLDVWLRRDIPEPTADTTVAQFLDQLESKAGIWADLAQAQTAHPPSQSDRKLNHYSRSSYQRHNNQSNMLPPMYTQQQWQTSTQPQWPTQNTRPYWGFPNNNPQAWHQNQNCFPHNWNRQNQWQRGFNQNQNQGQQARNQQQQLLIADKPYTQNISTQGKQPWNQQPGQRATAYPADATTTSTPLMLTTPSEPTFNLPPLANGQDQSQAMFQESSQPWSVDSCEDETVSYDASWNMPPPDMAFNSNTYNEPNDNTDPVSYIAEPQVLCMKCDTAFPSNNKLHTHLRHDECKANKRAIIEPGTVSYQVVSSSHPKVSWPGYAF